MKVESRFLAKCAWMLAFVTLLAVGSHAGRAKADVLVFEGFQYEDLGDNKAVIVKYVGDDTEVDIPGTIGRLTVTKIGDKAFDRSFNPNKLTKVTIPGSVTKIGSYAFKDNQLTSVTIPDSVTEIGPYAFDHNQLTSVTIPDSVTTIGSSAFANNQLQSVKLSNNMTTIAFDLFYNNQLTSVTIPDSVTEIGFGAFRSNQLTSVTIPDSVTEIGHNAFDSNQLTSVTIPDSVTKIGGFAFYSNQLTSVTIPENVGYIDYKAFAYNLISIVVIEGDHTTFGNDVFAAYGKLNSSVNIIAPEKYATQFASTYPFIPIESIDPSDIAFNPDGSGHVWVRSAKTQVTVNSSFMGAYYQWSESDALPVWDSADPASANWTSFNSGDEILAPDKTGIWYLHVMAEIEDDNGRTGHWSRHSESFYIDVSSPTIRLSAPPAPTNRDVNVNVVVDDKDGDLAEVKYEVGQHDQTYFASGKGTPLDLSDPSTLNAQILVTDNGWLSVYAKDQAGHEAVQQIEITNINRVKPVITLRGDAAMQAPLGSAFADPGYTATDDLDGDVTARVVVSGDKVDTAKLGTYTILYDVTDSAGNAADQVRRTVRVYDPSAGSGGESGGGSGGGSVLPLNQWFVAAGEGKTIRLGNDFVLSIPAGTTEQPLFVTITKAADAASAGEGQTFASAVFEIAGDKPVPLGKPVTISIKFDPAKSEDNRKVSIFYYDEEQQKWISMGGKVEGEWVTAETDRFAKFAILATEAEKEPPIETPPATPAPSFTDIAGHWGESFIREAAAKSWVKGYPDGTFRPNHPITRAEFLVMLVQALGLGDTRGTAAGASGSKAPPFADKDRIAKWAKEAVALAVEKGIVSGYADGSFRPDKPVTRAEMAVMIARALGMADRNVVRTDFTDDEAIPAWAKGAAEALRETGIVLGRDGLRFAPGATATRVEAVVMLLRALEVRK